MENIFWFIFLIPYISFLIISFVIRPLFRDHPKWSGYCTILAVATSLGISILALVQVIGAENHELILPNIPWATIGNLDISLGLMVDYITVTMLIVVNTVSLMVQIYSQGYMKGDTGYHRYYAAMSLFTGSMLGLVLADSLLLMFVFWEMVGLCSYLLIGFWFHKPSARNAAIKAFTVTRLGDFGFLAAILIIFSKTGTFDVSALSEMAQSGVLLAMMGGTALTWAAIGIFSGAVGKSAQFPLHTWLPDAMEGPTPVSALIHAATMVTAGVFLVARTYPIFAATPPMANGMPTGLFVVGLIGAITAIFAASMGLVANDIKRVLAYSTVSQLGYMMLGIAVGGPMVGMFHLFTHAFFKALLFLGSGSVNHASGTFDMRLMGGLRKPMPWTYWTFVIGSLSLAGIWPLAGFWSKDGILIAAEHNPGFFILAMITVFMTAFYMFRAIFMTFHGKFKGGAPSEHGGHEPHLHESPWVMVGPLVFLSLLAIGSGWFNISGGFDTLYGAHGGHHAGFIGVLGEGLPWAGLALGILGIFTAFAIYIKNWISGEWLGRVFKPFYIVFINKYWVDELYQDIILKKVLLGGLFKVFQLVDTVIIEGVVNGLPRLIYASGGALRRLTNGQLQLYGAVFGLGVALIFIIVYFAI
jgi:NADH-quinone oxidoreductase subunit L